MPDYKHIEQLVEKFLDGSTTNAEERLLYGYFAGSRVDRRLEKYRAMFLWYAGGMAAPLPEPKAGRTGRTAAPWAWAKVAVGAAASVLLLAGVALGYHRHQQAERLYATYEGSFIVRDGKKITDLESIMPELKRIERNAAAMASRSKDIGKMSPKEIFKMIDEDNKHDNNGPTI